MVQYVCILLSSSAGPGTPVQNSLPQPGWDGHKPGQTALCLVNVARREKKKRFKKRKLKNTAGQRRKVRCIHQASADNGIDFSTLKCLNIRSLHIYLLSFNRISRKIVSGSSFLKLLISPTNSRPLTWCEASGWCLMNSLRSEISWKHWEIRKMPQEKCASE